MWISFPGRNDKGGYGLAQKEKGRSYWMARGHNLYYNKCTR